MAKLSKISPCLWFDTQAEDAAKHYVGIFDGRITGVSHYGRRAGRSTASSPGRC